eukprot:1924959-Rhodomonas_salina.1
MRVPGCAAGSNGCTERGECGYQDVPAVVIVVLRGVSGCAAGSNCCTERGVCGYQDVLLAVAVDPLAPLPSHLHPLRPIRTTLPQRRPGTSPTSTTIPYRPMRRSVLASYHCVYRPMRCPTVLRDFLD